MPFMIDLFCLQGWIHCIWIELEGTVLFCTVNGLTGGSILVTKRREYRYFSFLAYIHVSNISLLTRHVC